MAFAQVIAPSLTGRAGGGSFLMAQEAFYVYRNDGDFNGFFYDQVIRMGYSKVDLDSVEHDIYVIQEIETADSLYRIPLAAIDSIGFVQPEIKLNPNLRNFRDDGLFDYVTAINTGPSRHYNDRTLHIKKTVPSNLMPQMGQILIDPNTDYYWDDETSTYLHPPMFCKGFAGKVAKIVDYNNDEWVVQCDPLTDLSDIFIQFISTEMITVDKHGNTKHRLAGWDGNGPRKASQGDAEKALIDFNGTVKRTFSPKKGVDITLECAVELLVKLKVSYYISLSRLYVKSDMLIHASAQPGLSLSASTSFEGKADVMGALGTIKFPVNLPIFQTKPFPALDVKASGSASLSLTLPKVEFDYGQSITFDSNAWPMMSFTKNEKKPEEPTAEVPFETAGDISLALSGSLQIGVEFSTNIATNDWVEDIFYSATEVAVLVGPKLEGSLKLSAAGLADNGAYGMMKNSYIKFHPLSADLSAEAELKFLWKDKEKKTFLEASKQFGTKEWYLFPEFSNVKATYNRDTRQIEASMMATRKTFLPSTIGIGLYDNARTELISSQDYYKPYFLLDDSVKVEKAFDTKPLKPGTYYIRPTLKMAGINVSGIDRGTAVVVPPYVMHNGPGRDSINVSCAQQEIRELITINIESVEAIPKYYNYKGDNYEYGGDDKDWLSTSVSGVDVADESAWLNINIAENDYIFSRYADICLEAPASSTTRDTIRIKQEQKYNEIKKVRIRYRYQNDDGKSEGDGALWFIVTSCDRSGDVFTINGYRPASEGSTYNITATIDNTNRKAPHVEGSLHYLHNEVSITRTFDSTGKCPAAKFTKSSNANWRNEDINGGVEMIKEGISQPTYNGSISASGHEGYNYLNDGYKLTYLEFEIGY